MLLYIHVPFCRSKCAYCAFHSEVLPIENKELSAEKALEEQLTKGQDVDNWLSSTSYGNESWGEDWGNSQSYSFANTDKEDFNSQNTQETFFSNQDKKARWLEASLAEIDLRSRELNKPSIKTLFFGGGTPSLLESVELETLMQHIRKRFKIEKKIEISLEGNPESLKSKEKIQDYLSLGVNRLSLGIQSLDDILLARLGRVHSLAEAYEAFNAARLAGCRNINIDMMWGLPSQRVAHWLKQVKELVKFKAEHISAYGLSIEADTPFAQLSEKISAEGKNFLPEEEDLSSMYLRTYDIFQEHGYLQYEISNYSRMGFQCRHNVGYWEGEDYIGIGPSATSTLGARRWTNPKDLELWVRGVYYPQYEVEREELSLNDRVVELIMLRLRTTRGLRVKAFTELTGRDFLKDNKVLIQALHKNGLMRIMNGYVRLTRNGFMVSNAILGHLFENTKQKLLLGQDLQFLQELEAKKERVEEKKKNTILH